MQKMDYRRAVDWMCSALPMFQKVGSAAYRPGLENTEYLMDYLGHPERGLRCIHVAGTNGKGSTSSMLASVLMEAGYRTGLYTSPHLIDFRERMRVDGEMIPKEFVADFVERHLDFFTAHSFSFFEMTTAMAFCWFRACGVDVAVVETGLGGRLDSTNVVRPDLSVITNIALDHTAILGDTRVQIAGEKAGIIKEGVPVIYDGRNEEAEKVIKNRAKELHAPAFALKEEMYEILGNTDKSIDFCLNCGYYEHAKVTAPYLAPYQVVNSSLALLAMDVIDPKQEISQDLRIRAIKETKWQGRMETVLPGVIVDGAHNADGIAQFVKTVQSVQERYRIVLLFSAVVEKNYEEMIHTICSQTTPSAVVVTEIKGDRIVPAGELSEVFAKYTDAQIVTEPDIEKAFERACTLRQDGLLFCAGSLYLVGEIKEILEKCKA